MPELSSSGIKDKGDGGSLSVETEAAEDPGNTIVAATEEPEEGAQDQNTSKKKRKVSKAPLASANEAVSPERPKFLRQKLAPPRPWPSVPTSSSATGPRSARAEGNNMICVTRNTQLSQYLRRCKRLIVEDGYKTIHLAAMGAAIPLLLILATSLPEILPHSHGIINTEYRTGTVTCMDELIPLEDDDDGEDDEQEPKITGDLQKRKKSSIQAVIRIGDGKREVTGKEKRKKNKGPRSRTGHGKGKAKAPAGSDDDMMSTDND
ncbi:hypothetical protein FRB96_000992 [Tulasnella sp. 330]|nr:hypothetical protein FRB96_000992 [Tulasnella sp. 330]